MLVIPCKWSILLLLFASSQAMLVTPCKWSSLSFSHFRRAPQAFLQQQAALQQAPFEEWAERNNIDAPKLCITGVAELRGVMALEPIAKGEEVCVVPRTACLDLAAVEGGASPCPTLLPTELWNELRWFERLGCWLIAEGRRGAASPVSGYMGYLPKPSTFLDAPLEWTERELTELAYPPLQAAIAEQRVELDALLGRLRAEGGPQAASVSLGELRWAQQLVLSRAFCSSIATPKEEAKRAAAAAPPPPPPPASPAVTTAKMWFGGLPGVNKLLSGQPPPPAPAAGDGLEMAMMPMLDAFNHASSAQTVCSYDGERNAFVLTSTTRLAKGEEATISYGDKSNDELLQLYGFVERDNPHDTFLSIGLEEFIRAQASSLFASAEEMERRFARLPSLELTDALLCPLRASGPPAPCLGALRVLLGSAAEMEDVRSEIRGDRDQGRTDRAL